MEQSSKTGKNDWTVGALLSALLAEDLPAREQAEKGLLGLGAKAVEPLIAALRDESTYVRWKATILLGKLQDKRAIPALTKMSQEDTGLDPEHGSLKQAATQAILEITRENKKSAKK
jgi:HEAT repeat protein